jgi:hypothetical protein
VRGIEGSSNKVKILGECDLDIAQYVGHLKREMILPLNKLVNAFITLELTICSTQVVSISRSLTSSMAQVNMTDQSLIKEEPDSSDDEATFTSPSPTSKLEINNDEDMYSPNEKGAATS